MTEEEYLRRWVTQLYLARTLPLPLARSWARSWQAEERAQAWQDHHERESVERITTARVKGLLGQR